MIARTLTHCLLLVAMLATPLASTAQDHPTALDLRLRNTPQAGIAHLDTLISAQPSNAQARFERGVALAEMGRCGPARRDFQHTLMLAPGADSQTAIAQALRDLCPTRPNTWERGLDVRLIADGNYNNATSASSIFLGPFEFTLDPDARAQERYGIEANAHIGYSIGLTERLAIVPSLGVGVLALNDSEDSRLRLSPGLALDWRGHKWGGRLGPVVRLEQGTDGLISRAYALEGRATRQMGPRDSLTLTAAWGRLNHRNDLDSGLRVYGEAAWVHQIDAQSWLRVSLGHSIAKRSPDFRTERSNRLMVAYTTQINADYGLELAGSIANIRADAAHPMFGTTRSDTLSSVSLGVSFRAIDTPLGTPVLGVSHTRSRSNIALHDYAKNAVFLGFSRQF